MPVSKPAADFATATGDYFVTITAGNKGRKRPILDRPSVATLSADTAMTYGSGMVTAGDVVLGGSYRYEVCAAGATDQHLTTAAGVKLKIAGREQWTPEAFGAVGDGVANDTAAWNALMRAVAAATAAGPARVYARGSYLRDQLEQVSQYAAEGAMPLQQNSITLDLTGAKLRHSGTGEGSLSRRHHTVVSSTCTG